ncbi:hypothetical protein [Raoultella ornithinolytica]|uniref:hypothetical protein n=1 Tax=Raoultella ornithinolytica TaxID=54291 RepID=UPI003EB9803A
MTTDITELAQSLKAAANTTADAIDRLKAFPGDELIDLSQHEGEQVDIDITTLNEWYELSSPANVLALVEALEKSESRLHEVAIACATAEQALEKAQQVDEELCKLLPLGAEYMDHPDGGDVTPLEGVRRMVADYRLRIAELESRTVKLPPNVDSSNVPFAGHAWNCCLDEVEKCLTAAGIKLETE